MLYIYTGDGKGKTSAALGLIMRAYGAGKSCAIIFFDKNPDYCSEMTALKELGIKSMIFGVNRIEDGGFRFGNTEADLFEAARAIDAIWEMVTNDPPEVLILDEILNAVRLEQVPLGEVQKIIDAWPAEKYLVLTGRGLPEELKSRAHLVSEILQTKHPFVDEKMLAVRGIDY
jgi:cob(I)alamin adenosyltransferase